MAIPCTIVFDVNETLTDQRIFAERFKQVGAPELLADTWYAATLRDGFALTMANAAKPYADVARAVLVGLLSGIESLRSVESRADPEGASDHIMAGFDLINPQPNVAAGLRALARSGHRLVTLSNGATSVATSMFARHGLTDCIEQVLSAEDAGAWKPHPRAYAYAAEQLGTPAAELLLVAVHPWDLDGASRAGLNTAFLDRTGTPWPGTFRSPDLRVRFLSELDNKLR